jgi:uncharacterized membrane protein YbhN (UPF0104 family)
MSSFLQSQRLQKSFSRSVPFIFYALLITFLVLYLRSVDLSKLGQLHPNWLYIGIATALGLLTRYFGTFIWLTILRSLGARDIRMQRQLIYVYAKSWMGRYIPGTAPWILGKIYFAAKHGVSKQKLAISSLLEGGLEIVTMLVLSFSLLLFDTRLNVLSKDVKVFMLVITVAGVVALVPSVFNRWVSLAYRLVKRKRLAAEHLASPATVLHGSVLYLINSLANGLSLFFIAKGIDPSLSYHNLLFVIGASSLAGAAGMVAVFAPSGLGVREAIQLVLFSLIMPRELALAVTVTTRLWIVGVDVMFFGLSRSLAGRDSNALHLIKEE